MKVLLADDHWASRAAIKPLLGELDKDIEFVEAETFDEALTKAEKNGDLDLIVCDLIIPGLNVLDDLNRLLQQAKGVPVAVFSMVEDRDDVLNAVNLGIAGFIPKTLPGKEIAAALAQVVAGEFYLPRLDQKSLPRRAFEAEGYASLDAAPRRAIAGLTDRQHQVLACLARGAPNGAIAKELGLSENTVRIHISAILRALELKNRTQAALLAVEYMRADRNQRIS